MNYFSLLSKSATLFNPVVPNAPFLYHLKTKPYGFMMFLGGREMVQWEQIKKKFTALCTVLKDIMIEVLVDFVLHDMGKSCTEQFNVWICFTYCVSPLSASPTKWSNTLTLCWQLPTNCLFDYFVALPLKELS